MQMTGCSRSDLNTAEDILNHLAECDYHFAFGIGNAQIRYNGKEAYLRDYVNPLKSEYITKDKAIELINTAIKI
jgi:hypothetical protein